MDIALVSQVYLPRLGGVPNQVSSLASYLRSRGHGVRVVTSTPGPADDGVVRLPASSPGEFLGRALKALGGRKAPDVVHGHDALAAAVAAASSRLHGTASVASVHDLWPLCPRGTYSNTLYGYGECSTKALLSQCPACSGWGPGKVLLFEAYHSLAYRGLDAVVAVSDYVKGRLAEGFGARDNVHVIHNWVDLDRFHPDPGGGTAFRLRQGIPRDGKLVLFFSRLIPEKGAQFLIEACGRLRAAIPGVRILVASDGWYRPHLEELAARLGVTDSVGFTGSLPADSIAPCYSAADVLAYPAIAAETFSLVPLEAAACGTAVCASDAGGTPEVVVHGRTGLVHRAGDAGALAGSLIEALSDDGKRRGMALGAMEYVRKNHTVERLGVKYEGVYEGL
jgi:glycosyltransferase involved in cell wall biosynthesis